VRERKPQRKATHELQCARGNRNVKERMRIADRACTNKPNIVSILEACDKKARTTQFPTTSGHQEPQAINTYLNCWYAAIYTTTLVLHCDRECSTVTDNAKIVDNGGSCDSVAPFAKKLYDATAVMLRTAMRKRVPAYSQTTEQTRMMT
jgi:hypothetical protein